MVFLHYSPNSTRSSLSGPSRIGFERRHHHHVCQLAPRSLSHGPVTSHGSSVRTPATVVFFEHSMSFPLGTSIHPPCRNRLCQAVSELIFCSYLRCSQTCLVAARNGLRHVFDAHFPVCLRILEQLMRHCAVAEQDPHQDQILPSASAGREAQHLHSHKRRVRSHPWSRTGSPHGSGSVCAMLPEQRHELMTCIVS